MHLALLVRAHRRKFPSLEFESVGAKERKTLVRLAVLLRLAVVLRRNRSGEALPPLQLEAAPANLTVTFGEGWLESHPLTRLDLDLDAQFLAVIPFALEVSG